MVVGDGTVGKTSMINRLVTGVFERDYKTTIGSQFALKMVHMSNNDPAVLQLWDVAGQARFKAVRKMYYSGASGIILIYDVTRESSFMSIQNWVLEAFESTSKVVPIALVGNKVDLLGARIVDSVRGAKYADIISKYSDIPTLFLETSAVTGQNVNQLFSEFADIIFHHKAKIDFDSDFLQNARSRVRRNGWHQTKMDLACHDKMQVLKYLGFPELSGLLITTEEILSVLPERGCFCKGIDALRSFLMARLEQQVKDGGPTFDLDIDRLSETEAARLVDDIIAMRFNEIRSLATKINSETKIDPWALWKTYYGRMLVKSIGFPREFNLRETREMLQQMEAAGITLGLNC